MGYLDPVRSRRRLICPKSSEPALPALYSCLGISGMKIRSDGRTQEETVCVRRKKTITASSSTSLTPPSSFPLIRSLFSFLSFFWGSFREQLFPSFRFLSCFTLKCYTDARNESLAQRCLKCKLNEVVPNMKYTPTDTQESTRSLVIHLNSL